MKMAFVCNGSSARAQMAAAIGREFFKDAEISAVGSLEGETLDPMVTKVLSEDGISTENLTLKHCLIWTLIWITRSSWAAMKADVPWCLQTRSSNGTLSQT